MSLILLRGADIDATSIIKSNARWVRNRSPTSSSSKVAPNISRIEDATTVPKSITHNQRASMVKPKAAEAALDQDFQFLQ